MFFGEIQFTGETFYQKKRIVAPSSMPKDKNVTLNVPLKASEPNTSRPENQMAVKQTKAPVITSIDVNIDTKVSGSKPCSNTKKDKISLTKSDHEKKVKEHHRENKFELNKKKRVGSSISSKLAEINSKSYVVCKTCKECLSSSNHDKCVVLFLRSKNHTPVKKVWKEKQIKQY